MLVGPSPSPPSDGWHHTQETGLDGFLSKRENKEVGGECGKVDADLECAKSRE